MCNIAQLRLFHLKLDGDTFTNDGLYKCLRRNIGYYVYSRSRIAKFKKEDDEASINLEAPKIFSKIELDTLTTNTIYDGVHLLKIDDESFQMVFGTSNVENQIDAAIDNAFSKIQAGLNQPKKGIPLLSELIFAQNADSVLADKLEKIITPSPDAPDVDSAYGIFLCYFLGLSKENRTVQEYKNLVEQKMVSDIKYSLSKIKKYITDCGLSSRSFYIYAVPLDDATEDKTTIMKKVTGGAYGN